MNCAAIRRRLFTLTEPDQPPAALQAHLASCPACQDVHRRLLQAEQHIPHLPVPASSAKAAFLQKFRSETTVADRVRYRVRSLERWQLVVASMAAGVLLFFGLSFLAPHDRQPIAKTPPRPTTPDVLLDQLVKHNLALAVADEPRQQVETLARLAEDLRGQSEPLLRYGDGKDSKEALKELADWYGQTVRLSVTRAGSLPVDQRRATLDPIVKQLNEACDAAEATARTIHNVSADHPFYAIAFAARNGKDQLDILLSRQGALQRPATSQVCLYATGNHPPLAVQSVLLQQLVGTQLLAARARAAAADAPVSAVAAADQAQRFQRNRKLIQALVEASLNMAKQNDLVERADSCMIAAEQLAQAIDQAAADQDVERAQELALAFKVLLQRGVAFNLTSASVMIPIGHQREPELLQIGDKVKQITTQLDESIRRLPDRDRYKKTFQLNADGRAEVFKALKGRGSY